VRIRVAVHNVRGFRDDRSALEELHRSIDADVLLLNETGPRWKLRRFARTLDYRVAHDARSFPRRRAKDAVLARAPWRIAEHRQQRFSGSAPLYPRAALFARLELEGGGSTWWAVSMHLGLRPTERIAHAEQVLGSIRGLRSPVVLGGDLNELPDGAAVTRLTRWLHDAWAVAGEGPAETFPARDPSARIDYVLVSQGFSVAGASVPRDPMVARSSDHRPVVVDLELRDA